MDVTRLKILCDLPPSLLLQMAFTDAEMLILAGAHPAYLEALEADQPLELERVRRWQVNELARDLGITALEAELMLGAAPLGRA